MCTAKARRLAGPQYETLGYRHARPQTHLRCPGRCRRRPLEALRNARQLRVLYAWPGSEPPDDPAIPAVIAAADTLARDVSQAVAVVGLIGTSDARAHAQAIYNAAKAASELYHDRSLRLGTGGRKAARQPFDATEADARLKAFRAAIDAFTEAVRPEFGACQTPAVRPRRLAIRR